LSRSSSVPEKSVPAGNHPNRITPEVNGEPSCLATLLSLSKNSWAAWDADARVKRRIAKTDLNIIF